MTRKYNLQDHEDKYIHIPKVNLYPLFGLILLILLSIGNFHIFRDNFFSDIFSCKIEKTLPTDILCSDVLSKSNLVYIYPIIGQYILLALCLISLIAFFKGGYNQLNSYDEGGLIGGLIFGLIGGLIVGLIFGLIGGLIVGLIGGLIFGLIVGLISGLILGLIVGLSGEF